MRYIIILLLNLAQLTSLQGQDYLFSSLDVKGVLKRLFDTEEFMINSDKKIMARWKPNYAEQIAFRDMGDFIHTEVDTIFRFNAGDQNLALFVFASYQMSENGEKSSSCHACAPMLSVALFSKNLDDNEGWFIDSFMKIFRGHGTWGAIGGLRVEQIGKSKYALVLEGGGMQHGTVVDDETYYEVNNFREIFSITTLVSGSSDDEYNSDYQVEIKIIPNGEEYYPIKTIAKGSLYSVQEGRAIPANSENRYYFSEEEMRYIKH